MTKMIDIKVKDQFSHIIDAQALIRKPQPEEQPVSDILNSIEHIVVNGEIIQPSIEWLFESQDSSSIYKVVAPQLDEA